jgi:hypothetical protein
MNHTKAITLFSLLALFAGCGGGSPLPEPAPCPPPVPTAPPAAAVPQTQTTGQGNPYVRAVRTHTTRLADLLNGFRATWPNNKFYRTTEFRADFVRYAAESGCVIAELRRLTPTTSQRSVDLDTKLKPFLVDYEKALSDGTEAVRKRNTSDYRDWAKAMDALAARQTELFTAPAATPTPAR